MPSSPPAEAGVEKYAPNVAPMLAVLRYGFGMQMNRVVDLQKMFGVPLPLGTQWEQVKACYAEIGSVIGSELVKQAAAGSVLHNDDTNGLEKDMSKRKASVTECKVAMALCLASISLVAGCRQYHDRPLGRETLPTLETSTGLNGQTGRVQSVKSVPFDRSR